MAFRYVLRDFDPAMSADALLEQISPAGKGWNGTLGREGNAPWVQVVQLLRQLGARSLLVQGRVRDPDFVEEHQAFYSRQHRPVDRYCIRVHAFTRLAPGIPTALPQDILAFLDAASQANEGYLGFVTIRPLRHAPVGATILVTPSDRRAKAKDTFPVHIAGCEFEVSGTPFLQQDNAVGACAQASIWMALRTLRRRQGNAAYSPAELTVAATRLLAVDRAFPGRQGLTIEQMLEAVRFAGHDPLRLSLPRKKNTVGPPSRLGRVQSQAQEVLAKAGPYIESGLPVILVLDAPTGWHAVVAIGQDASPHRLEQRRQFFPEGQIEIVFETASNWSSFLTIHNDNSGPYLPLAAAPLVGPLDPAYVLEDVASLIVPLPDGIFMTAAEAEVLAVRFLVRASIFLTAAGGSPPSLPTIPYVLRAVLVSRHAFRTWIMSEPAADPAVSECYRTHELPPYLWLVEIHDAATFAPGNPGAMSRCGEIVLDAAADFLHADGLIFAAISRELFPGTTGLSGLLYVEGEQGGNLVSLTTAFRGRRIVRSW